MDTRLKIWREVKKSWRSGPPGPFEASRKVGFEPELYLDARMGAEVGKVLVVHPSLLSSCRKYEEDLYPSSEAFQAPCTAKATIYCAAGLAAYVGATVAGYAVGRKVKSIVVDWVNMGIVGV